MKSKYCFLRSSGLTSPEDFVYVVWVGSSLRELAIKSLVEEYARDAGLYFKVWSPEVDSDIEKASARYQTDANGLGFSFRTISISIKELSNLIVDDSFGALEKAYTMTESEKWCRFHNSIEFVAATNHSHVLQNASPSLRKYLSLAKKSQRVRVVACFVGMMMIFALDALVSHIGNSFFSGCF